MSMFRDLPVGQILTIAKIVFAGAPSDNSPVDIVDDAGIRYRPPESTWWALKHLADDIRNKLLHGITDILPFQVTIDAEHDRWLKDLARRVHFTRAFGDLLIQREPPDILDIRQVVGSGRFTRVEKERAIEAWSLSRQEGDPESFALWSWAADRHPVIMTVFPNGALEYRGSFPVSRGQFNVEDIDRDQEEAHRHAKEELEAMHTCFLCFRDQVRMSKCGRCRLVRYCSQDCQRKDWKSHQQWCKGNKD